MVVLGNTMPPLIHWLNQLDGSSPSSSLMFLRNATWSLSNLFRYDTPMSNEILLPTISTISRLIFYPDEEVLIDVCWTLSYISEHSFQVTHILEAGILKRIVELTVHHNPGIQTPALRTIGNICGSGDIMHAQVLV